MGSCLLAQVRSCLPRRLVGRVNMQHAPRRFMGRSDVLHGTGDGVSYLT